MGFDETPITLHKYLYANVDPVNMVDPSGKFSLSSISTASNINKVLNAINIVDTGISLLDSLFDPDQEISATQAGALILLNLTGGKFAKFAAKKPKNKQRLKDRNNKKNKRCKRRANSFLEGTLVWTENGMIPIEKIKIGDKVWAMDVSTAEVSLEEVTHLIRGEQTEYFEVGLHDGLAGIKATQEHPFWTGDTWVRARDLSSSSPIYSLDGVQKVREIRHIKDNLPVVTYNISVANKETYFVGREKLLVHNASGCSPEYGGGALPGSLPIGMELLLQSVSSSLNISFSLVGSQAFTGGFANFSDWDFVVEGGTNRKLRKKLKKLLPRGPRGTGENGSGQDFLDGSLNKRLPHVTFRPR